jgi:hypothetical protein
MTEPTLRQTLRAAQKEKVEDDGFITAYPAPTHGRGEPGAGSPPPPVRPPEEWGSMEIAAYQLAEIARRDAERKRGKVTWPALFLLGFVMTWLAASIIAAIAG